MKVLSGIERSFLTCGVEMEKKRHDFLELVPPGLGPEDAWDFSRISRKGEKTHRKKEE